MLRFVLLLHLIVTRQFREVHIDLPISIIAPLCMSEYPRGKPQIILVFVPRQSVKVNDVISQPCMPPKKRRPTLRDQLLIESHRDPAPLDHLPAIVVSDFCRVINIKRLRVFFFSFVFVIVAFTRVLPYIRRSTRSPRQGACRSTPMRRPRMRPMPT